MSGERGRAHRSRTGASLRNETKGTRRVSGSRVRERRGRVAHLGKRERRLRRLGWRVLTSSAEKKQKKTGQRRREEGGRGEARRTSSPHSVTAQDRESVSSERRGRRKGAKRNSPRGAGLWQGSLPSTSTKLDEPRTNAFETQPRASQFQRDIPSKRGTHRKAFGLVTSS